MSVTVPEEVPTAGVLSVVQTLLSRLGILVEPDFAPLWLEVVTSRARPPLLPVSPTGNDVPERALGGDAVSLVSSPEVDADLGPRTEEAAAGEEPAVSRATPMGLAVATLSGLSDVQGPEGVMWAVGTMTAVSVSTEAALSARSLPDVCADCGTADEQASPTGPPACCPVVTAFSLGAVGGPSAVLTHVTAPSSNLSVTELVVSWGAGMKLVAES